MTIYSMEVVNGKQVDQLLTKLAKEFGSDSLLDPVAMALEETVKPLKKEIHARTPVRTGKLRDTIYHDVYRNRGGTLTGAAGYRFRGKARIPQAVSALILEYGSDKRNYPRKRMLERTFNNQKASLVYRFKNEFTKQWEKTHAKHNKTKKYKKLLRGK